MVGGCSPICSTAQDLCNLQPTEEGKTGLDNLNHMLFYIFSCVTKGLACCWPYDIMLSCSLSYFITSFSWFSWVQFDFGLDQNACATSLESS